MICMMIIIFLLVSDAILFFFLRKEKKEVCSKKQKIDRLESECKEIKRYISGDRKPSILCAGCKNLIVTDKILPYCIEPLKEYYCKKNLQCSEYEEEI